MYSEVLEPMKKLMLDAGENQPIWADCYHIDENKFLFEDLCVRFLNYLTYFFKF